MLGAWLAAMLIGSAPSAEAAKAVPPQAALRDLAAQLRDLQRVAAEDTAVQKTQAGLRDPFSRAPSSSTPRSPQCSEAEQASGDRSVRCRTRLQTPFS